MVLLRLKSCKEEERRDRIIVSWCLCLNFRSAVSEAIEERRRPVIDLVDEDGVMGRRFVVENVSYMFVFNFWCVFSIFEKKK